MGKKLIVFLLTAMLLLGMVGLPAGAESAGQYEVGYAKVDINPYWYAWMEWSKGNSFTNAGTYPYQDFYEPYDIMPLPMAGYGNNASRLSRPKLMDDNGSGVGASKTNVTRAKTSATGSTVTLSKDTFYSYVYANNANYQDVHLSSNRYTKEFAKEMGVTYADGVYGENDGDGLWATCVLVKDPQTNSYLLMITVDNIGLGGELNGYIRQTILEQKEVKALGLTEDRILITSNHTHGGVDTGASYSSTDTTTTYTLARDTFGDGLSFTAKELHGYLNFYKNYLRIQLAAAAVQAIGDLEVAQTMEKGTIDAGLQTGHHVNGVRHNVQTYTPTDGSKPSITYVRGSSFNNYMRSTSSYDAHTAGNGFTASQPVSESNDRLQILQFTFASKDPIAMVNFRAHSTANNKEAAKALHYNLSADWVSPLRYELEQAGYRFSLLYGNSGNLGTGVSSDTNSLIPYNQAFYSSSDRYWVLPATAYGRALAQSALALLGDMAEKNNSILDPMHTVPMGKLLFQQSNFLSPRQEFSPLSYAATMKFYLAGSPAAGGRYTINDGEKVTYDGKSVTLKTGEGGTYVIASKYHANSIWARYGVTTKTNLQLNTVRLGDQVAFYTTPIEAADRYFTNTITKTTDIVANASKYNDWWTLNEESAWGVPFDLSLTNGSSGYIANELAYDYNNDYTGTDYMVAIGSYESQNSNHARGTGEVIVATLNGMLRSMGEKSGYCEACKSNQTWQPLQANTIVNGALSGGHYFLVGDYDIKTQTAIASKQTVCLDLNGFTYSAEAASADSRAFSVAGRLNIMDHSQEKNGTLQGMGKKNDADYSYGTLLIETGATVHLYSGNVTAKQQSGYDVKYGGVIGVEGTFFMHGGGVYGGVATSVGGNIFINGGDATLSGGTVSGGNAINGGSIYLKKGSLTLAGATVSGGTATNSGGNIYTLKDTTLTMSAGTVSGGTAQKANASMGGNIYVSGSFLMSDGLITGGSAYYGGNVQVQSKTASFTMRGGLICDGTSGYKTDVSDLCTGQSGSEGGYSNFRMEGGYIASAAYSQGIITLTGTNDQTIRVVVKVPGERLYIEGVYTGNINLSLNDANYLDLPAGSKIGNAVNADISGATIHLVEYPNMILAVEGSNLVLREKPIVAVNGTKYTAVSHAVAAYNTAGGWMQLLDEGLEISGLTRDLYLDLNGCDVAGVNTGAYKLICKDTATDDYSSETADTYGCLPAGTAAQAAPGYLAAADGVSFHKYDLAVTAVNLRPANAGIYYSCTFRGDELVKARVSRFGVAMSLKADMTEELWKEAIAGDPESKTCVWYDGALWETGENTSNGVLVQNILKSELSDGENQTRAEMAVNGVNFLELTDGTWLFGNSGSYSLQQVVEAANDTLTTFPDALLQMFRAYESLMSQWKTDRIAAAAN